MNNHALEVLFARRPKLDYVCPAICEAVFSSTSFPTLVLEALPTKPKVQGVVITYTGGGGFQLTWNNYPGALCYSVYKTNDATDPFGEYHLIAECITDPRYAPEDWEPFPPEPGCYLITAVTLEGETPFSDPICNFIADIAPEGPFNALVGEIYSQQLSLVGVPDEVDSVAWAVTAGALPEGVSFDTATGLISGVPTEDGVFNFIISVAGTSFGANFTAERGFQLTVTTTTPDLDLLYLGLSGNATAFSAATINEFNFLTDPIPDGTSLSNTVTVDWTVDGSPNGFSMAFQGISDITSGLAGNYKFSVDNLTLHPVTFFADPQYVTLFVNSIALHSYDLSTQTGLDTFDFTVVEGDQIQIEFAIDGLAAPAGSFHTSFNVTAIPPP